LSRISGSFVIARNSAFTYKGKSIDVRQVGQEFNIRYALEGSVQRSANRLRVNVQLVEAETRNHLWAERFDKFVADLFDMQDEIVSRLANALKAQLIEAEARRAALSPHPDAMDLFFQGKACFNKGATPENIAQACYFFERALALDPGSVEALASVARVEVAAGGTFMTDEMQRHFAAAEAFANKALSIAPQHALAHLALGAVQIFTNRAAQGISECEQALALDRNLADAHGWIGRGKYFLGRAVESETHIKEAFRLSPRDSFGYHWMLVVGGAKLQLGDDTEAVLWLRRSLEANRKNPITHFFLAAALALLGSIDEARIAVQVGLAINPGFTIQRFRARGLSDNPTFLAGRERVCEGLRIAGVPEG
jgi:tetratricopeptide (TPR) repeat protein